LNRMTQKCRDQFLQAEFQNCQSQSDWQSVGFSLLDLITLKFSGLR